MTKRCLVRDCQKMLLARATTHCSSECRILLKYGMTKSDFTSTVAKARSWSELARLIDPSHLESLDSTGKRIRRLVDSYKLDTSHFVGQAWNKGNKSSKRTLDNQLGNSKAHLGTLKRLLIESGIKDAKCERPGCGLSEWFGRPAVLELEHVDGNKRNNGLHNLRIYCLQCHAQTPTWRRAKSSLDGKDVRPEWEIESKPM